MIRIGNVALKLFGGAWARAISASARLSPTKWEPLVLVSLFLLVGSLAGLVWVTKSRVQGFSPGAHVSTLDLREANAWGSTTASHTQRFKPPATAQFSMSAQAKSAR